MAQFMNFAEGVAKTGNGYIQVPVFEKEILDLVGKRGALMQRLVVKKATGNPTRYFEKNASAKSAAFQDPHQLAANKFNTNRVEKAAFIKAITNEIEFSHFDREVGEQQGLYNGLTEEDIRDMVTDLLTLQDANVWNGNDTSLSASTTNEYVGLLTQITQTGTIAAEVKICDAIRTEVARLAAKTDYDVKPSAIYVNPLTYDLIEQEEQDRPTNHKHYEVEMTAGTKVIGVMTAMGVLPIIPDPYIPLTGNAHKVVILSENLITRYYVGSPVPRIFGFGMQDESLNEKYMALQYDCVVAKGAEYAHTVLTKTVTA
jgi:hypothetical protein